MATERPIKVLLADLEYCQYRMIKNCLSSEDRAAVFWCGEPDHYRHAIESGIYDLVLMEYSPACLFILEEMENKGNATPVVIMSDEVDRRLAIHVCECGAIDVMSRKHPDLDTLRSHMQRICTHHKPLGFFRVHQVDSSLFSEYLDPVGDNSVLR